MQSPSPLLKQFRNYFLAKAFDVVGNGTYRKHLAHCKDVGDPWAVEMTLSIQTVQSLIKDVTTAVHSMPPTSNRLHEICKDVMMSAQPPIKLHPGCIVCSITQRQCMKCLDLSKTHKGNSNVYVDARFCFFFMLLWFCNKLEYIVRSMTRTWLDMQVTDDTFQVLCCKLQEEMEQQIVQMHKLFVSAQRHVMSTLQKYAKNQKMTLNFEE
jgi:hypothetical protein